MSRIPLTPNAELYTLQSGPFREENAEICLPHSLVEVLREWAGACNDIAYSDQRYVDDELEAVLKRLFEKSGPLVSEHLPSRIDLDVDYDM